MPPADLDFFEKKVRPVFVRHCYKCHSDKEEKRRGGLTLDSRTAVLQGGDTGPAVVPGQLDKSLLIQAVRYQTEHLQMPPSGKLPDAAIADLAEWVRRGAPYPEAGAAAARSTVDFAEGRKFWSFQPPRTSPPPACKQPDWPRTRIDPFLLAELEKRNLAPSPEANRRTLIRRAFFDLLGLPPTPEEVLAFQTDSRPDAYERLVERLLASSQYGERWGRYWLDLVRYCDVGEQWANLKGQPYLYRDWVVNSLNADLPYDRFVQLQLAADQMSDARPQDVVALGLLGLSPVYWKELKLAPDVIKTVVAEELEERIDTVASCFLGLTVACARCHDHKFDPISQHDYYALAGVFASTRQADRPVGAGPTLLAPAVEDASLLVLADGPHRTKLEYKPGVATDLAVHVRGNPATTGPVVPRRFLTVLSAEPPTPFRHGSGRLELAAALVREGAPLSARVIVNRVWKHHFGEGLVTTPSNFGTQGARPSHPELLDDLTARFMAAGWSLKWLHREIMLSAAYRQESGPVGQVCNLPEKKAGYKPAPPVDPDNRWLGRMNRRRLDIEAWRDAMLAVSGNLDLRRGGPPADLGDARNHRRTLYGTVKRRELHDMLRLHDFPDPTTHSAGRLPTTTPLQQLFVLNGPLLRRQAAALVRRLQREGPDRPEAKVRRAYQVLFGREPSAPQLQRALAFLTAGGASPAEQAASWEQLAQVLLGNNEFLFID